MRWEVSLHASSWEGLSSLTTRRLLLLLVWFIAWETPTWVLSFFRFDLYGSLLSLLLLGLSGKKKLLNTRPITGGGKTYKHHEITRTAAVTKRPEQLTS